MERGIFKGNVPMASSVTVCLIQDRFPHWARSCRSSQADWPAGSEDLPLSLHVPGLSLHAMLGFKLRFSCLQRMCSPPWASTPASPHFTFSTLHHNLGETSSALVDGRPEVRITGRCGQPEDSSQEPFLSCHLTESRNLMSSVLCEHPYLLSPWNCSCETPHTRKEEYNYNGKGSFKVLIKTHAK